MLPPRASSIRSILSSRFPVLVSLLSLFNLSATVQRSRKLLANGIRAVQRRRGSINDSDFAVETSGRNHSGVGTRVNDFTRFSLVLQTVRGASLLEVNSGLRPKFQALSELGEGYAKR